MPEQMLLNEILDRLNAIDKQGDENGKCLAVLHDRLKHHMEIEHKDFNALLEFVQQGKATAKVLSMAIAGLVALASAVAWIVDHLPRFQ